MQQATCKLPLPANIMGKQTDLALSALLHVA